jgi:hypothetical protein
MKQVFIENPILNIPFEEPSRYFNFSEDGKTGEIVEARRISQYFNPIPRPKRKVPGNSPLKPSRPRTVLEKTTWSRLWTRGMP